MITTNRLNNLIGFTINFYQLEITDISPDYIKEKWDKWIGCDSDIKIDRENVKDIPIIKIWIDRWKVSDEDFESLKNIMYFIHLLQNRFSQGLEILIETFEETIGETHLINDCELNLTGIHPVIINHILPILIEQEKDFFREVQLRELLN